MSVLLALLIGLWVGAPIGFFVAALCQISADADRRASIEPSEAWPRTDTQLKRPE